MAIKNKAQLLTVVKYTNMDQQFLPGYEGVATQGKNLEYATIRVMQRTFVSHPVTGVTHKVERTAQLTVQKDFLEDVELGTDMNEVYQAYGQPMKRIIAQESFEPFREGQSPKINRADHKTAPLAEILVDGENIYYQTKCVNWNSDEFDSLLEGERTFGDVVDAEDDSREAAIAEAQAMVAAAKTPAEKKAAQAALAKAMA